MTSTSNGGGSAAAAASERYGRDYFVNYTHIPYERSEHWLKQFAGFADNIVRDFQPHTVLDAGCAMGFLVEALRDRGVEAEGIDISEYALSQARDDVKPFLRQASLAEPLTRNYDLIVSIEVLEHLTPADAGEAVANLCAKTDQVIFSSTPEDYKEVSHLNVRGSEYWAEMFARSGFVHDLSYSPDWLTPWAMLFRRSADPLSRVVYGYEVVHERLTKENRELRFALNERHATTLRAVEEAATDKKARVESDNELHQARHAIQVLTDELARAKASVPWRVAERGRSLLPSNTRRGRIARRALRAISR
jgi:2-polyprenyl-3-methyl-5-hydroxy-6-metoxy-1,4-benzoquinol methylase